LTIPIGHIQYMTMIHDSFEHQLNIKNNKASLLVKAGLSCAGNLSKPKA